MIRNAQARREVKQKWAAVRKLERRLECVYLLPGYGNVNASAPPEAYNLPFFMAYAVLDQVLSLLRDQGEFVCRHRELGPKMAASRNALPWQSYGVVDAGRDARNNLAHKAKLADIRECRAYIDAIETELRAWFVL
jgi:hypothetical protein